MSAGARPPPDLMTQADATCWLLRAVVGFAPALVALDELTQAGPSPMHAALPLGPELLGGVAALELLAGLALLRGWVREGASAAAAIFGLLCAASLAAGVGPALHAGLLAAAALVLVLLDPVSASASLRGATASLRR